MAKVDISITRSLTINTGNYESVKPTVTLTVRDVDANSAGDVYSAVDDAITGLMKFEIIKCVSEVRFVGSGLDAYCKKVVGEIPQLGESIDKALEVINKY